MSLIGTMSAMSGIADQRLGIRPVGAEHLALVDRHVELAGVDAGGDADLRASPAARRAAPRCRRAKRYALQSLSAPFPPTFTWSLLVPR